MQRTAEPILQSLRSTLRHCTDEKLPQQKSKMVVGIKENVLTAKVNNLPKYILINEKMASICGTMSGLVLAEQYSGRGNKSINGNSINTKSINRNFY